MECYGYQIQAVGNRLEITQGLVRISIRTDPVHYLRSYGAFYAAFNRNEPHLELDFSRTTGLYYDKDDPGVVTIISVVPGSRDSEVLIKFPICQALFNALRALTG